MLKEYSYERNIHHFYLVKTNNNGDRLWTKHYGGKSGEISNSVRQTSDGGCIMIGNSESFGVSTENMYVVKTIAGLPGRRFPDGLCQS